MGKKHKKHKSEKKSADISEDLEGDSLAASSQLPGGDSGEKPLKLVLKVGLQESGDSFASQQTEERNKHKHKKKKKKKEGKDKEREEGNGDLKRSLPIPDDEQGEVIIGGPAQKKLCTDGDASGAVDDVGDTIEERVRHSPRSCAVRMDDGAILRQCLEFLQKNLQNKDVNGFFAYPVTDSIAPGYSNIIHSPMDFSTMETKIERNEYRNVMEYKKDFMLMCNNAMTYNRPETVYYKEAKRLLHLGAKQLSKERLLTMKKTQSWLANLTLADIGIDENGKILEELPPVPEDKPKEKPKSKSTKTVGTPFEPFPDSLSPEEILAQATASSKETQHKLTMRKPKTDLVFLRRNKKGVTSLNILNPENDGFVSETERVVNLAEMMGKLPHGTGSLPSFKEDKRNKMTPIQYVNYGPFSSFAPQYDSSFATLNKEESDLLLSTYGDETGVQYAKSVQSFVDSAGDYAVKMVNNLLDMLTKGQHTRTNHALEQQRKLEKERATIEESEKNAEVSTMPNQVLSPSGDGPETGGLETAAVSSAAGEEDPIQNQLNRTAGLLGDLQQAQEARLSQPSPAHLSHCPGPSDKEIEIAAKVNSGLVDLAKAAAPGNLVSVNSIRNAMGIIPQAPDSAAIEPEPEEPAASMPDMVLPGSSADSIAVGAPAEETLEPLENLPSAGTASESIAASHATEDEEDEDDDEEEEEVGMGEDSLLGGIQGEMIEESLMEEEQVSQEPADLSEFFSSPPLQEEASMDGGS